MARFDLEKMPGTELRELATNVIAAWGPRDAEIELIRKLKDQEWDVEVPIAFKNTTTQVHNSISREIPTRVAGLIAGRRPTYSRMALSEGMSDNDKAAKVERFCMAADGYYSQNAVPGKDAVTFATSQIVDTGAVCVGTLFAPHAWAAAPEFLDEQGQPKRELWRDSRGEPTEKPDSEDRDATARHYLKLVDAYRQQAKPPIFRRYMETPQCYPLFLMDTMHSMFVKRQVTTLELDLFGFDMDDLASDRTSFTSKHDLLECWLPNRVRYFVGDTELAHPGYSKGGELGIPTNYGFVPFTYQGGIEGGSLEYGKYHHPVLWLVASQIKLLDTLDTFNLNAIYLASFPTYKFRYNQAEKAIEVFSERNGKETVHYAIKSGEINDFGPDRELVPLEHSGMNNDFYQLRTKIEEQIDKIIPRTLRGEAESSGYNTLQVTAQAKAIFDSLFTGMERLADGQAKQSMMLIDRFVKRGPVYFDLAVQRQGSSRRPVLSRIGLTAEDIQGHYQIKSTVDKELDRVTLGSWAAKMNSQGYGNVTWVEELSGIEDSVEAERQRAKDRVMRNPLIQQQLDADAVEHFKMRKLIRQMKMTARIAQGQGGMPQVKMPDGTMFGPKQTPEMQGAAGAMLGGLNLSAGPGNPNLNSGATNPEAMLPQDGQPQQFRMGGGAVPGAAQLQNLTRPAPKIPL